MKHRWAAVIARRPCSTRSFYYRCFLPDLTGFVSLRRTGPSYHRCPPVSRAFIGEEDIWRRERDSNPRYTFWAYTRFPIVPLQPTRASLRYRHLIIRLSGGERGIRTPGPDRSGQLISNQSPSAKLGHLSLIISINVELEIPRPRKFRIIEAGILRGFLEQPIDYGVSAVAPTGWENMRDITTHFYSPLRDFSQGVASDWEGWIVGQDFGFWNLEFGFNTRGKMHILIV